MLKKLRQSNQGFTIIEVLIVLAIAALILLIVFLAVPALQRNSRNTTRQDEAARFAAAVSECLANRNGLTASCDTAGEVNVGTTNQITSMGSGAPSTTNAQITFAAVCSADGSVSSGGGTPKAFTLVYLLEPSVSRCIAS